MISAVILTKNEENNILNCLNSLVWCDEIIIVDDYSTDNTLNKIQGFNNNKIKVFKRHLRNDFSAQRNYGLDKARSDWVLFIDADEKVSDSLQFEILTNINNSLSVYTGYYLRRKDYIWGKLLNFGESYNSKFLRLAKKNSGTWKGKVHEVWEVTGRSLMLNNPLIHAPHQTLENFLYEINYYTDIRASELYTARIKTNFLQILFYPVSKFIYIYFIRLGIMDGMQGLVSALVMSFHSFLVRGKLWQLWKKSNP